MESITDYGKILLLIFLIKNDMDLLLDIGFSERDKNHLNIEIKNILIEQLGDYLAYIKNQEESIVGIVLKK